MRIVLLGAPGSGKGTQANKLTVDKHIPQVSTGDMLRAAVAAGTRFGQKARAIMETGAPIAPMSSCRARPIRRRTAPM